MKANSKTYYRSGGAGAPEAKNTAPKPAPKRSIGGYGKIKTQSVATGASGPGTSVPTKKRTAKGYGKTGGYAPAARGSGGPRMSGSSKTRTSQGTGCPKFGPGPGGMGRTGTGAPWGS